MAASSNPVRSHIVVHENYVDCGRPMKFDARPFTSRTAKPLTPDNTHLHIKLPDEAQHKRPEFCEECKLVHYIKWQARRKQLPCLIALVMGLMVITVWLLWK